MISSDRMTQKQFIRWFSEKKREEFNPYFFERLNENIFKEVERIIKSCERDQYFSIRVISFQRITGYREIQEALYAHEEERRAMKKKPPKFPNPHEFIDINDSDIMLLRVVYALRIHGDHPEEDTMTVLLELPRFVDKYYYRLNGTNYAPIFQIVDRSTYNNATSNNVKVPINTMRTQFMTIRILTKTEVLIDYMSGEQVQAVVYDAFIFNKLTRAMRYLLAKFGYYGAKDFLEFGNYIHLSAEPVIDPDWYCFNKGAIFISVPKAIFVDRVVQSFVVTVIESIIDVPKTKKQKATEFDEIFDPRYWIRVLSSSFKEKDTNLEKGLSILNSLEMIYDLTSRDIILLPDNDSATAYHILRWLMRENNRIRNNSNLDITFKRIRMEEPIATLLAIKMSKGIYRISDEGKRVTMKMLKSALYVVPEYIITNIKTSKVVNFDNLPNDNDAINMLSYTFKGISGLGEDGSTVQNAYRRLDPSHIGRFDLDSSSSSDPGLTGVLCPYGTVYKNGLFSEQPEPNFWREEYNEITTNYNKLVGMQEVIQFRKAIGVDYDHIKDEILAESINNYRKMIVPVVDINGIIDYTNPMADTLLDDE